MFKTELLRDFEETLSRLIENQEALNAISTKVHFSVEQEALKKTQESLLAHLVFLNDIYPQEKHRPKGTYIKEQLLLQQLSYLKTISPLQITLPFTPTVRLRNYRLKKLVSL